MPSTTPTCNVVDGSVLQPTPSMTSALRTLPHGTYNRRPQRWAIRLGRPHPRLVTPTKPGNTEQNFTLEFTSTVTSSTPLCVQNNLHERHHLAAKVCKPCHAH